MSPKRDKPKPVQACEPPPGTQVAAALALAAPMTTALDTFLLLPWPPSVNHYWLNTRRGLVLSARAKAFRNEALGLIGTQRAGQDRGWPFRQRLAVRLVLHAPDRRDRDVDNLSKGVLDALKHAGVIGDDEQIDTLIVQRSNVMKGGCIELSIIALPEAPLD